MKIYLSGPMTGKKNYNYKMFDLAEKKLIALGYAVLNPAKNFKSKKRLKRSVYMRADLKQLMEADEICFLPGWKESKGAKTEYIVARELNLKMLEMDTALYVTKLTEHYNWQLISENTDFVESEKPVESKCQSVLSAANFIVNGDRKRDYGESLHSFTKTTEMLNALGYRYIYPDTKLIRRLVPEDLAYIMICEKLKRQLNKHKQDNLVDIAGYVECANHVIAAQENKYI